MILRTQEVRFISCEYEPVDVAASTEYLYVAHDDGNQKSTISKIRVLDGVTVEKIALEGIATRIFASAGKIYVFCDRLITPPNANQKIYLLDLNLGLQKTLTHPYSYLCHDVIQQDDSILIANIQAAIGIAGASSLISLHLPSGSIRAHAAPPSTPVQFLKYKRAIYLACRSGEIMQVGHHNEKLKQFLHVEYIGGSYIKGNTFFYLGGFNDQLYAVDLISKRLLIKVKAPWPKYQSGAVLIFPRHI